MMKFLVENESVATVVTGTLCIKVTLNALNPSLLHIVIEIFLGVTQHGSVGGGDES